MGVLAFGEITYLDDDDDDDDEKRKKKRKWRRKRRQEANAQQHFQFPNCFHITPKSVTAQIALLWRRLQIMNEEKGNTEIRRISGGGEKKSSERRDHLCTQREKLKKWKAHEIRQIPKMGGVYLLLW
ncbi:hypothetical protein ACLOJK_006705 [Asimina triloba]